MEDLSTVEEGDVLPAVAIIIPVHNRHEKTLRFLDNLFKVSTKGFSIKVVVIDDGSTDGTFEDIVSSYPEVEILKGDGNLWWAGGVNKGFRYALKNNFDYVYTVNDDVEIEKHTLERLFSNAQEELAVYGSIVVEPESKTIVSSGYCVKGFLGKFKIFCRGQNYRNIKPTLQEVDALSSMSTLLPIQIIKAVGFYDALNFPHNFSDIDYSLRVKQKSYKLFVDQKSIVYSSGSGSNFHRFVIRESVPKIFLSFFDKKYGHNIRTIYNSSCVRNNPLKGFIIFLNRIYPFCFWLIIRTILPRETLKRLLIVTKRLY